MTLPALPAEGNTAWYAHYAGLDAAVRNIKVQYASARVGEFVVMGQAAGDTNHQPAAGVAVLGFMHVPPGTYDAVGFHLDTVGSTGATTKAIAYYDNDGSLGSLAFDTTAIDTSVGGGGKLITGLSLVVPAGGAGLHVGIVNQGSPTTLPKFQRVTNTPAQTVYDSSSGGILWAAQAQGITVTGVTGAAPTSPTAQTARTQGYARIAFRRSA